MTSVSSTLEPAIRSLDTGQGYLVVTAVNWPWNGSPISNCKDVSCMHKLTQVDLCIIFGCHLARLRRLINILRDYIWARDMVMWHWSAGFLFWQLSIDMNIQCHLADVNLYVTLCLPSLHGWGRHIGVTPPPPLPLSLEQVPTRELHR